MAKDQAMVSEKPPSPSSTDSFKNTPVDSDISDIERRARRKVDFNILPIMTVFYLLSFLDRANIGNARVAGLERDLRLSDWQYQVCITVVYVPYILSELPSNLVLRFIGPRWLLPTLLTLWGIVTVLHGVVSSFKGLLAARFFLGMLEGPMLPGIVLYLSGFYTRLELGFRVAILFTATSLAGSFSGLLAAAISKMEGVGNKPGWAWIFILEGLLTFIVGLLGFFLVPSTPQGARFLSPEEKLALVARLERDRPTTHAGHFRVKEIKRSILSPHVLLLFIISFLNGTTLYGLAIFMPSIVRSLGFSPIRSQLLTVGPFAAGFFVALIFSYLSDRYKTRSIPIVCGGILSSIGYIIYLCTTKTYTLYGSLFLTLSGVYSIPPLLSAWMANNSEPHYRRAASVAFSSIAVNCGGILSTWSFPTSEGPRYTRAIIMNLVFVLLISTIAAINGVMLHWQNKRKRNPIIRQQLLAPFAEDVKKGTDSTSESQAEHDAYTRAWLELGDKHPDFVYAT